MTLKFTILGCGSSGGVPRPALGWGVCDPTNPKNRRRRCSLLVERHSDRGTTRVLIDTSPDLREQLLDANVDFIDAIFLTGVSHTKETIRMLKRAGIPVVEGGNVTDRPIDMVVGYSNVKAAAAITRYLVKRGYAKIGYIGAFPQDNDRARDRRRGYELALATSGRKLDPALCVETTLDIDAGSQAMAALLKRRPDVRAVFCSADAIAVGALFECERRNFAVLAPAPAP